MQIFDGPLYVRVGPQEADWREALVEVDVRGVSKATDRLADMMVVREMKDLVVLSRGIGSRVSGWSVAGREEAQARMRLFVLCRKLVRTRSTIVLCMLCCLSEQKESQLAATEASL
jgi:hypothetical protein